MKRRFVLVATFQRSSDRRKVWKVKADPEKGILTCNCPSWIFQRKSPEDRTPCKHIRAL